MSAKRTDISQIRKYLTGELDAPAMHQLEREAQDDPFLMDALEGFSLNNTDQQQQLAELENSLQQRARKGKVYRMPSRLIMAIAASVLIICSVAYLLWPAGQQAAVNKTALTMPPTPRINPSADTLLKPNATGQQLASNVPPAPRKIPQQEEVSPAGPPEARVSMMAATETPVVPDNKTASKDSIAYAAAASDQNQPKDTLSKTMAIAALRQAPANENVAIPEPARAMKAAVMAKASAKISGMVSNEIGHPLAGVMVTEKGKSTGVKTDKKGKFAIPGQDGDVLSFTLPGYDSKDLKGETRDSLNVILRAESKSISEMVAIGYGQTLAAEVVKAAHPQIGWDNYNNYLKQWAILTEGKAGMVRLSFTVDGKGQLGNFKITKELSPVADKQAIALVKDGPPWAPDASGQTKTISLKISFTLKQP